MTEAQEVRMSSIDDSENLRLDKSLTPTTLAPSKMVLKASQRENILPAENGVSTKSPVRNNNPKPKVPPKSRSEEDAEWREHTEVITKVDHDEHVALAGEVLSGVVNNLPLSSPDGGDTVSERSYFSVTSEVNVSSSSYQTAVEDLQLDPGLHASVSTESTTPFARNSSPNRVPGAHLVQFNSTATPITATPFSSCSSSIANGSFSELDSIVGHLERLNLNATYGCSSGEALRSDDKGASYDSDFDPQLSADLTADTSYDLANISYDIIDLPLPAELLGTQPGVPELSESALPTAVDENTVPARLDVHGYTVPGLVPLYEYEALALSETNEYEVPANLEANRYEDPAALEAHECGDSAALEAHKYEDPTSLEANKYEVLPDLKINQHELPANFEANEYEVAALEAVYAIPVTPVTSEYKGSLAPGEVNEYEVPALLDATNEVPALLEASNEVPALLETTNEVPALFEASIEVPALLDATNEVPSLLEASNEVPAHSEASNEVPALSEASNEVPALSEASNEAPAPLETKYEAPCSPEANVHQAPAYLEDKASSSSIGDAHEYTVASLGELSRNAVEANKTAVSESLESSEFLEHISVATIPNVDLAALKPVEPCVPTTEDLEPEVSESLESSEFLEHISVATIPNVDRAAPKPVEPCVPTTEDLEPEVSESLESSKFLEHISVSTIPNVDLAALKPVEPCVSTTEDLEPEVSESLKSSVFLEHISVATIPNVDLATLKPVEPCVPTTEDLEPEVSESLVHEEVVEQDLAVVKTGDPAVRGSQETNELTLPAPEAIKLTSSECRAQNLETSGVTPTASLPADLTVQPAVELSEPKEPFQKAGEACSTFHEANKCAVEAVLDASHDASFVTSESTSLTSQHPDEPVRPASQSPKDLADTSQGASASASPTSREERDGSSVEAPLESSITASPTSSLADKSTVETTVTTSEPASPSSKETDELTAPSEEEIRSTPIPELSDHAVAQALHTAAPASLEQCTVPTALETTDAASSEPLVNELTVQLPVELNEPPTSELSAPASLAVDDRIVPASQDSVETSLTSDPVPLETKTSAPEALQQDVFKVHTAADASLPASAASEEPREFSFTSADEFFSQGKESNELAVSESSASAAPATGESSAVLVFAENSASEPDAFEAQEPSSSADFATNQPSSAVVFESNEPPASAAFEAYGSAALEAPCSEQENSTHSFDFLDKLFEESGAFEDEISRIIGLLGAENPAAPMPSADAQTMADAQNNSVVEPSRSPDLDNNEDKLGSRPSPEIAARATLVDNANGSLPVTALSPQDNATRGNSNHGQDEHVFKLPHLQPTGPSSVSDAAESTDLPIQPCLLDSTMSLDSGIDDLNNTKQRNGTPVGEGVAPDVRGITQTAVNFSEAGPDVADCRQEEFKSATDFFMDPKGLDFLEKHHGKQDVDSALARMSLYVKFDPCLPERARVVNQWLSTCGQPETPNEKEVSSPHRNPGAIVPLADSLKLIDLSNSPPEAQREEAPLQSSPLAGVATATPESAALPDQEVRRMLAVQELLFQERLLMKDVEYDKRVKQLEKENAQLRSQVQEVRQSQSEMTQVVCEYEKTLTQLIADSDRQKQLAVHSELQLTKDRDQALEDMQNVELAFGDLHRRYEKLKKAVEGFRKNEETLTKCLTDFQETIKSQNERYEMLKLRAEDRLESANFEIENARKSSESEVAALRAQLKMAEMRIDGLEKALEQKGKENSELTNICDELIAQVGKTA